MFNITQKTWRLFFSNIIWFCCSVHTRWNLNTHFKWPINCYATWTFYSKSCSKCGDLTRWLSVAFWSTCTIVMVCSCSVHTNQLKDLKNLKNVKSFKQTKTPNENNDHKHTTLFIQQIMHNYLKHTTWLPFNAL